MGARTFVHAFPLAAQYALVLANSRRIESGWLYSEQELAKLIRIAEAT